VRQWGGAVRYSKKKCRGSLEVMGLGFRFLVLSSIMHVKCLYLSFIGSFGAWEIVFLFHVSVCFTSKSE
jgi:hypothetical protein